jgi:hypothetical protein
MENWIQEVPQPRHLYLAWQAPDHLNERFRWAVGLIEQTSAGADFRYFPPGAEFEAHNQGKTFDRLWSLGFRGYPALGNKPGASSTAVLPALLRRLPPRGRADFDAYKRQFRLLPEVSVSQFALLGLTEAKLPSDGFSVVDPLDPEADRVDLMLEIAGYRYYADAARDRACVGTAVDLVPEPTNEHDANAVMIKVEGQRIGYINRLQASTFHRWLAEREVHAVLERLNGQPERPRAFVFVRVRPALAGLSSKSIRTVSVG